MSAGVIFSIVIIGGVAAMVRFALGHFFSANDRPPARRISRKQRQLPIAWGIVIANAAGSAVGGFALGLYLQQQIPFTVFLVLSVGVAGGLSTFSTLVGDSARMLRAGNRRAAVGNVLVNVLIGLFLAATGFFAALLIAY